MRLLTLRHTVSRPQSRGRTHRTPASPPFGGRYSNRAGLINFQQTNPQDRSLPGPSTILFWPSMLSALFIDMNSYFASCEQHDRPELRGKPIAVAPVQTDYTCCIAASYEAKAFGIKTGTAVWEALIMLGNWGNCWRQSDSARKINSPMACRQTIATGEGKNLCRFSPRSKGVRYMNRICFLP